MKLHMYIYIHDPKTLTEYGLRPPKVKVTGDKDRSTKFRSRHMRGDPLRVTMPFLVKQELELNYSLKMTKLIPSLSI